MTNSRTIPLMIALVLGGLAYLMATATSFAGALSIIGKPALAGVSEFTPQVTQIRSREDRPRRARARSDRMRKGHIRRDRPRRERAHRAAPRREHLRRDRPRRERVQRSTRHRGARYRSRRRGYQHFHGGYWYAFPWWLYAAPTPRLYDYDSAHVRWCLRRYKSYNPRTDRYLGFDGFYHRCISPYS